MVNGGRQSLNMVGATLMVNHGMVGDSNQLRCVFSLTPEILAGGREPAQKP